MARLPPVRREGLKAARLRQEWPLEATGLPAGRREQPEASRAPPELLEPELQAEVEHSLPEAPPVERRARRSASRTGWECEPPVRAPRWIDERPPQRVLPAAAALPPWVRQAVTAAIRP